MHADQCEFARECPRHHRPVSTKRDQHMSPTVSKLIISGGEPTFVDRLIPGPYPSQLCKPRSPSIRYPVRLLMIDIELPETALPGNCRHARHEGRIILGDDSLVCGDVDHAVVSGNDHHHVRGQGGAQPLTHSVDPSQLFQPGGRVATVHVPAMIKFPLVRVDHTALTA